MRIVFMGSSNASAVTLLALIKAKHLSVVGVVTQPDRPSGRHQHFTPCPCKVFAAEKNLAPVITPENVNAPDILEQIEQLRPDAIVVVAFGQFLGKRLLALPPFGCINGHFSLLPKYRGASPVQAAIAAGDEVTGVTVMQMAPGMDDGDILLKGIEPICSDDTAVTLMERLAILGAVTMTKALRLLAAGAITPEPQGDGFTLASKMQKADGLIDWTFPARLIERRTRAFVPWPGAFTFLPERLGGIRVKIHAARLLPADGAASPPGAVHSVTPHGPVVGTGDGA
jgi:methionyl-tRNA formyltransferase